MALDSVTTIPTGPRDDEYLISRKPLKRVLEGVAVATKTPIGDLAPLIDCVSSLQVEKSRVAFITINSDDDAFSLIEWYNALLASIHNQRHRQLAVLAVCIAFLREHSRQSQCAPIPSNRMKFLWDRIYGVLTDQSLDPPLCSAVRSSQDFHSVALCSLVEDGNIEELFRLHVWLPDGKRGKEEFKVHSHQPFAHSWILAGEGTDIPFDVEPADAQTATHAAYTLAWSDGKNLTSSYSVHHPSSVVVNTGTLYRAVARQPEAHVRDMTYIVPSAKFHTSVVAPEILHATFFFFDSQRGFDKDAGVLGPIDGKNFAAHRDPASITAFGLAQMVQAKRSFEMLMDEGEAHMKHRHVNEAMSKYKDALHLCRHLLDFPNPQHSEKLVLGRILELENHSANEVSSNTSFKQRNNQLVIGVVGPD